MDARQALRHHWPEYLIEAAALGTFMVSAGVVGTLLEAPGSPLRAALPDPGARRALAGLAMGLTAIALIHSPWGRRSGAHMNPAVTLTFWHLGKVQAWDAAFYVLAQFLGGLAGVLLVAALLGAPFRDAPVLYVATLPGPEGTTVAFVAELLISAGMMAAVLASTRSARFAPYTGLIAGLLVAVYIFVEAPLSGMSMNPARSFASAAPAGAWQPLWIYLLAPLLGMLGVAALAAGWARRARCAKLLHAVDQRCIHCGYEPSRTAASAAARATLRSAP
ncbi:MAG: aquaporin [Steroidobacteraceae bacterium]